MFARDEFYDLPPFVSPSWWTEDMRRMYQRTMEGLNHPPGPHCPRCHALLEREDAIGCLNCGALLVAPIDCVSEAEARRRGWIE